MDAIRAAHPGKRLTLRCQDEARVGQKGRVCHRCWFTRGQRPAGPCDQRCTWARLFAAVRPSTGQGFALVLPEASTRTMRVFLGKFAATPAADEHAAMVLDRAGWHGAHTLVVPGTVTLVPLPPYAPQLNPVERVWLYLRERHLSHRLLNGYDAMAMTPSWMLAASPGSNSPRSACIRSPTIPTCNRSTARRDGITGPSTTWALSDQPVT
jgi:DDE superfamily endonuclease